MTTLMQKHRGHNIGSYKRDHLCLNYTNPVAEATPGYYGAEVGSAQVGLH